MKKEFIYGLDLSLNSTGICVFTNDGKFLHAHTIDTNSEKETKLKLYMIGKKLLCLKKEYPPFLIIMEQGFTRYNPSTQAIFRVHGLVNYLFYECEQVYYPASTIKKVVGGAGNMTKEEIRQAIAFEYPHIQFKNYDESDAFATGLTYFIKERIHHA